jgi:cytochrome oxidase Cu insertion factor (SCO1/SenC/PrrC family)
MRISSNNITTLFAIIGLALIGSAAHNTAQAVPNTLGVGKAGPVDLSALPGPSALLYLGYSRCAESCPLALRAVERALSSLGTAARQCMSVVFVDIGENDTDQPAAMRRQHAQHFLDSFLAGGMAVVPADSRQRQTLIQSLGAEIKPLVDPDPLVLPRYSHARSFYLVSKTGTIEQVVPVSAGYEILLDAMKRQTKNDKCQTDTPSVGATQK